MKKRIMTVVLALTMVVSLSACGSKSDVKSGNEVTLTMDEIQNKMTEAMTNVKSVDAELNMSMEASRQSESLSYTYKGEVQASITNPGLHSKVSSSMSEGKLGMREIYVVTDGDKASIYIYPYNNDWIKSSVTKEELMEEISKLLGQMNTDDLGDLSGTDKISSEITDQFTPALNSKTVEVAGKECYAITGMLRMVETIEGNEYLIAIDKSKFASMPGMAVAAYFMNGHILNEGTMIRATMYVDVVTNLPVKLEMTADIDVPAYEEDTSEDEEELFEGKMVAELELEYDKTETIEVPNEVKDSAEKGEENNKRAVDETNLDQVKQQVQNCIADAVINEIAIPIPAEGDYVFTLEGDGTKMEATTADSFNALVCTALKGASTKSKVEATKTKIKVTISGSENDGFTVKTEFTN